MWRMIELAIWRTGNVHALKPISKIKVYVIYKCIPIWGLFLQGDVYTVSYRYYLKYSKVSIPLVVPVSRTNRSHNRYSNASTFERSNFT